MTLTELRKQIPDYAKDLRLNLGTVLSPQGAPGLGEKQIWGVALASAISARNVNLASHIEKLAGEVLSETEVEGVRAAAAIMGMTNIYYRFLHLVDDDAYGELPARLRMNVVANPGIDKTDFELYALAASAVTGCAACVRAHERHLRKAGLTPEGVQSAARIASVIHGVAIVIEQDDSRRLGVAA